MLVLAQAVVGEHSGGGGRAWGESPGESPVGQDIVAPPDISSKQALTLCALSSSSRTGIVYNVTARAVGVIVYKVVGNRYMEKRVNLRVEHVKHSKCRDGSSSPLLCPSSPSIVS